MPGTKWWMWRRPMRTLRNGPVPTRMAWVTARAAANVAPKERKRFSRAVSSVDLLRYPARTTSTVSRAAIPPLRASAPGPAVRGARPRTRATSAAASASVAAPATAASLRVRARCRRLGIGSAAERSRGHRATDDEAERDGQAAPGDGHPGAAAGAGAVARERPPHAEPALSPASISGASHRRRAYPGALAAMRRGD